MKPIPKLGLALLCAWPMFGWAGEVTFKGFASVVAGLTVDDEIDSIYGYTDDLTFRPDSLFALQMDSQVNDRVSATIQLLSKGSRDFEVDLRWGYLTFDLSDSWDISAGRMRIPFYRYSDFSDVHYAYNWLTTPDEVYGFDIPGYEGISAVNTTTLGNWDSTFQLVYGNVENELANDEYDVNLTNLAGANWVVSKDWFALRLGLMAAEVDVSNEGLQELLDTLRGVGLNTVAEEIEILEEDATFYSVGFSVDPGSWLLEGEYVNYLIKDGLLPETDSWYVMAGKRVGAITYYATVSEEKGEADYSVVAPLQGEELAGLRAAVSGAIRGADVDTSAWNVGMRWDFLPSTAFKVSYQHIKQNLSEDESGLVRLGFDVVF